MRQTALRRLIVILMVGALSGCAGGEGPSPLTLPGTGGLPDVAAIKQVLTPADAPRPVGAPTEIYTRVARGILTCWFGANGPLKPLYVFNADAEPPSRGGGSVISIHTRDKEGTDPRSIRAWKLAIIPAPEGTSLQVENFKLPEEWAQRLDRDVRRWAATEEGCGEGPVQEGWASQANAPALKAPVRKASDRPR